MISSAMSLPMPAPPAPSARPAGAERPDKATGGFARHLAERQAEERPATPRPDGRGPASARNGPQQPAEPAANARGRPTPGADTARGTGQDAEPQTAGPADEAAGKDAVAVGVGADTPPRPDPAAAIPGSAPNGPNSAQAGDAEALPRSADPGTVKAMPPETGQDAEGALTEAPARLAERLAATPVSAGTEPTAPEAPTATGATQTELTPMAGAGRTATSASAPASAATAPSAPLPGPAPASVDTSAPDWTARVAEAVQTRLTRDGATIEMTLRPADLGRLDISMRIIGDTAEIAIRTETAEAARLFSENERRLAEDLSRHGLTLAQHHANPRERGTEGDGRGPRAPGGNPARAEGAETPPGLAALPARGLVNLIA